ncbi:MAG TPA: nuclear transport factor 2 family protein [Candidatus Marinimicrobia bacterium]|jgi:hypothetical protein|nr:nuclear transport factor 2 family protein [Candidatus Neomarinimicrobiota bacterium]HIA80363.1 nuclear transport factor 2 family protein [Candidatus Neomarinimicrobiota bacterium]HIO82091.1 nuclear transport factor 2 family protein [Candidatus Poribacteria bacterium]
MKHLIAPTILILILGGCETAQKSNGFVRTMEGYSYHISGQSSVDLVMELDKAWAAQDYEKMRTFFADTASFSFAEGEKFNSLDGFIGHVKKQMEAGNTWTAEYAFAVDVAPGEGGDWVNAAFRVELPESDPKKKEEVFYEWYYVKNGKIHTWSQSKQVVLK